MRASPIQTYLPNYLSKIRVIPLANEIIYEKYVINTVFVKARNNYIIVEAYIRNAREDRY